MGEYGQKQKDDIPKGSFGPDAEILQDEPDSQVVLRIGQLERAHAEATDEIPREHATRGCPRVDGHRRHAVRREQWPLALLHLGRVIGRGDGSPGGRRAVIARLGLRGQRRRWQRLLICVLTVVGREYGHGALLIGVMIGHLLMHGQLRERLGVSWRQRDRLRLRVGIRRMEVGRRGRWWRIG